MEDMSLTVFDMTVLFVVGVSALLALARGLVRESLSIVVWAASAFLAYVAFPHVREPIAEYIPNIWIGDAVALIVVFVAPLVCLKVVAMVIADTMPRGMFGSIDHLMGAAYGLLRGSATVCLVYIGLNIINEPENHPVWIQEAQLLPYVRDGAELLAGWVPDHILTVETWQALPEGSLGRQPAHADGLAPTVDSIIDGRLPKQGPSGVEQ